MNVDCCYDFRLSLLREENSLLGSAYLSPPIYVQGVQEKLCFFTINCNPSLAYNALRDLQSCQRNASVQSLLLTVNFFVQPIAAECWRGRGGKLKRILGKQTQYLMNNLYAKGTVIQLIRLAISG